MLFSVICSRHDRTRLHARYNRLDRFHFSRKIRKKGSVERRVKRQTIETNRQNITFRNRSGRHEKLYPSLISKVNLSRGLIKSKDQTWGPCFRTICLCCPPASVAIVRPGYPRGELSFSPTRVDTFHVIMQHRLILCINIVLYFAQEMLPLYHILLLIFSDWMDPEAGTGRFCASTSVKRGRERDGKDNGAGETESEQYRFSRSYPPGIFIIRDLA